MNKQLLFFLSLVGLIQLSNAQFSKIHDFDNIPSGSYPDCTLVSDGISLYGTARLGGLNNNGIMFEIKPDGSGFLKRLDCDEIVSGRSPNGSLFYDGVYFYGTTSLGGNNDYGTVYKIKPDGSNFEKLFDFDGSHGRTPLGSLVSDGTFLYGTTGFGGTNGDGVIFRINKDGSGYVVLFEFNGNVSGLAPNRLMIEGSELFGMTRSGGSSATQTYSGDGTIFKINSDGTGYLKLLDFVGTNGSAPYGGLLYDDIYLYGMTRQGGALSVGNIFKIKPDGSGFEILMEFDNLSTGANPQGSLIFVGNNMYGMTWGGGINGFGTLFSIKKDGSDYIKHLDFEGDLDGKNPFGSLLLNNSALYGTTYSGGINNEGIIFKFDVSTNVSVNQSEINYKIDIFPNPTNGEIRINSEFEKIQKIRLFSIGGQEIANWSDINSKNFTIDLLKFPTGLLFLEIVGANFMSQEKIMLN